MTSAKDYVLGEDFSRQQGRNFVVTSFSYQNIEKVVWLLIGFELLKVNNVELIVFTWIFFMILKIVHTRLNMGERVVNIYFKNVSWLIFCLESR